MREERNLKILQEYGEILSEKTEKSDWIEWKHVSRGESHCPVCLSLDKCWFVETIMPILPQHPHCHCTKKYISESVVKAGIKVDGDIRKFTEYLFIREKSLGKFDMFKSWGYTMSDSEVLLDEYKKQAALKYANGDYKLAKLDIYGQCIAIDTILPKKSSSEYAYFKSGWLVCPNGKLHFATPYADA